LISKQEIHRFCVENKIDFVVIGGEQPVADGLTDHLREQGIRCIGPSRSAGRIETSKTFAKEIMRLGNVPTARFCQVTDLESALSAGATYGYPLVLKADGLAAGKGVLIVKDEQEANQVIENFFRSNHTQGVIAEEYLQGWELSLFAICDGTNFQTTIFSQDHKQLYDHDLGPNTGGMGAIAPVPEGEIYRAGIEAKIISPVIRTMREQGCPFSGFLYCGLMITPDGPKVVEFNCRWGDPEAEAVLPLLETDLTDICLAIADETVDSLELSWKERYAAAVVLASRGYPAKPETGFPISMEDQIGSEVYWAGVALRDGTLVTNGGRVLAVTGIGDDPLQARDIAYRDLMKIKFDGMTYRRDIGLRSNSFTNTEH